MDSTKPCRKCGAVKSLSEFFNNRGAKDGHRPSCKECERKDALRRYHKGVLPALYDVPPGHKRCRRCNEVKPLDGFYAHARMRDGYLNVCKACYLVYSREHGKEYRDRKRQEQIDDPPPKQCSVCKLWMPASEEFFQRVRRGSGSTFQSWCRECFRKAQRQRRINSPERARATATEYRRKSRLEVLIRYGGSPPRCACCGESHLEFLAIDHIDGGGVKHRGALRKKAGQQFAAWLKQNNYPDGYRVLCHNCNCARGFYGACPHEVESEHAPL